MIQICAWCEQEDQRNIPTQNAENPLEQVSHGICRDHARRLRNGLRRNLLRRTHDTSPLR